MPTLTHKVTVINKDVVKSGPSQQKANDIHEGKWNGLGGKFEAGETPEECVIREIYEESGLSIWDPKLCGLLIFPQFKGNDWYGFVFAATDFSGELIDSPEGKLEWIHEGKFFSAKFEYEGDKMRKHNVLFHVWL
jgi:8-oxo-dGTP diphosphatase